MKLPYRKNAVVEKIKITGYLLSLTHPKGKSKAKFFREIGFNETNIEKFEQALLDIGKNNPVDQAGIDTDEIRTTYPIYGFLCAPNGKKYKIKTVWALEHDSKTPHLATAW